MCKRIDLTGRPLVSRFSLMPMRASRLLTSWLVLAVLCTAGVRMAVPAGHVSGGIGDTGARIASGDAIVGSEALLAAPPVAPVAGVDDAGRPPVPTGRHFRIARLDDPPQALAARIAKLSVARLAFTRELDLARFGWFFFGSTAPPPFQG
jgi:hypothetical protein